MSKISLRCDLENISTNIDGTISYHFRQIKANSIQSLKSIEQIKTLQETAKNGLKIDVDIFRKQRSLNANAYFHLLVDKLAKHYDLGLEEMKTKLVLEYGAVGIDKNGKQAGVKIPKSININEYYKYAKWFGEEIVKGIEFDKYLLFKQTHNLDNKEMAFLINGTISECQQVGIETITETQKNEMLSLWKREGV